MKMIIAKTMTQKQEKELTDWITTSKNGIVVYEVNKPDEDSAINAQDE